MERTGRPERWTTSVLVLALVTAVGWFGWMGLDVRRDADLTGPWDPWQVVGFLLSMIVVCSGAGRWLPAPVITLTMTVAFAASLTISALLLSSGGWLVVILCTLATTAMMVGSAAVSSFADAVRDDPERPSGSER